VAPVVRPFEAERSVVSITVTTLNEERLKTTPRTAVVNFDTKDLLEMLLI
jgi:hypothetical protein